MIFIRFFLILLLPLLVQGAWAINQRPINQRKYGRPGRRPRGRPPPLLPVNPIAPHLTLPPISSTDTVPPTDTHLQTLPPIKYHLIDQHFDVLLLEPSSTYGVQGRPFTPIPRGDYYRVPAFVAVAEPGSEARYLKPNQVIRLSNADIPSSRLHQLLGEGTEIHMLGSGNDTPLRAIVLPPGSKYDGKDIPEGQYFDVPPGGHVTTPLGHCPEASGRIVRIIDNRTLEHMVKKCKDCYDVTIGKPEDIHISYGGNEEVYIEKCKAYMFRRLAQGMPLTEALEAPPLNIIHS